MLLSVDFFVEFVRFFLVFLDSYWFLANVFGEKKRDLEIGE